mgnify:CR=1 FL=1
MDRIDKLIARISNLNKNDDMVFLIEKESGAYSLQCLTSDQRASTSYLSEYEALMAVEELKKKSRCKNAVTIIDNI